ncbi:Iota-carrageenase [Flavivirga aquatica]|uniref:Iota-carrageenase n=1 Tax=Flavivirga aquatica TaxID=1849968 RepID=A0A1E5TA37_9FLAO|nr:glycosyl hydrolase family 28-related protein [Flavivirga aquatica]OEK08242.1 Iota-carrageenase [Flavivirga aquatica]
MKLKFRNLILTSFAALAIGCSTDPREITEENPEGSTLRAVRPNNFSRNRFYRQPVSFDVTKNLVDDFGVNNTDTNDDSAKLNRAINSFADGEVGRIIIPEGNYYLLNIRMKSNVHLEIAKGATIFPVKGLAEDRNHRIFNFGARGQKKIESTSVYGKGGRFTVDLRNNSSNNLIVADIGEADGFRLANLNILDDKTIFASVLISFFDKKGVAEAWPHNGIVENITQTNAHTGYGLIQGYAADNVLFKNLKCTGGVTLRLETDNLAMKKAGKGGLRDIFANKIIGKDGLTPVMFSPHFMENGKITIDDVTAIGCAYAVRVEHGFIEIFDTENRSKGAFRNYIEGLLGAGSISNIYRRNNGTVWAVRIADEFNDIAFEHSELGGIKPGKFETSEVTNVKVVYKNSGAKIKEAFLQYLPCGEWDKVCRPGESGFEYSGPSLGITIDKTKRDGSLGNYDVNVTVAEGKNTFPSGYILHVTDSTPKGCSSGVGTIASCDVVIDKK